MLRSAKKIIYSSIVGLVIGANTSQASEYRVPPLFGVTLGDTEQQVVELGMPILATGSQDDMRFTKFELAKADELSITTLEPDKHVVYIELDWGDDRWEPTDAGVNNFFFGYTHLSEIKAGLGEGFVYPCRLIVDFGDAVLQFTTYYLDDLSNQQITFVTETSRSLIKAGFLDISEIEPDQSLLVSVVVAKTEYIDQIWCERPDYAKINIKEFLPLLEMR